jgi:purine-nucleoside phosphorylase
MPARRVEIHPQRERFLSAKQSNSARVEEAANWIRQRVSLTPHAGIILGTGLGRLAEAIEHSTVIAYDEIPHFPRSTAPGHRGQLRLGMLAGMPVVAMEGRFHTYEGYGPQQTAFPVHVMNELGIEMLIVSNAAGGMNPYYKAGDVVVVDDHINLMGGGPALFPRDVSNAASYTFRGTPYDPELVERAMVISRSAGFQAHRGVYIAVRGPNFETRAEYRFFRRLGGDVVGMSTVPEVLAARDCGLRVLALSTVTNVCLPDALKPTSGEIVIAAANQAAANVMRIMLGILELESSQANAPNLHAAK